MGKQAIYVPGLLADLFPGRRYPDLTDKEKRRYHSEYTKRGGARRREIYHANVEASRAKARAWRDKNRQSVKDCQREASRRFRALHPERAAASERKNRLKREYGLTSEQYEAMVVDQGGRCALCRGDRIGRKGDKKLHVDHCHKTGKVRALLCHHCNMVLGHCMDDPALLRRAAGYVEEHAGPR